MKLSLSKKPEAVAWSIEDLLDRVRNGEIRLPEFQRLYKWEPADVVGLFDSIVRGFPIGTFLFWQRPAHSTSSGRALEHGAASAQPEVSPVLFVLDGQQRLTSLAGVLLSVSEPTEDSFRVAFSLDSDELIRVPAGAAWPPRTVPLFRSFDSVELMTWANEHGLDAASTRRALEIGKAIREYRVPAYIVIAEAEETARLIYDRVNSSGKALTKADVFKALHEGIAAQSPNTLEGLDRSVKDLGFGPLRESLFLQAAAAVAGLDVTKIDHHALARPELGAALPGVAPALRQALGLLQHDAHIPSSAFLPYGFALVALTRFFFHHASPRPRSRELLARWVWRGAITGKHWAHEQAYLRETLRLIEGKDEEAEVQRMLALLPRVPTRPAAKRFSLKSVETRLHLLALLELRPRDLISGELLDAASLIANEQGAAVLSLADEVDGDPVEAAARETIFARVIQRPSSRDKLLRALGGLHVSEVVLESLGLTREEVEAILSGKAFAAKRQERLTLQFDDFFERRARWTESDRPSLGALIVEDEP